MSIFYRDKENVDILRIKTNSKYSYLEILPCPNPFCDCSNVELAFFTEDEYLDSDVLGVSILADTLTKEILTFSDEEEVKQIDGYNEVRENICDNLGEEDWHFLRDTFITEKRAIIDDYIVVDDHFLTPSFDPVFFEDQDLRVNYQYLFPHYEQSKVVIDSVEYSISEDYCKKIDCTCNMVNLGLILNDEVVNHMKYKFKDDVIISADFDSADKVIELLKEKKKYLELVFTRRELDVKLLFAKFENRINQKIIDTLEEEEELNQGAPIINTNKIGRNEPCPCGSGKKYKKCCLNLS